MGKATYVQAGKKLDYPNGTEKTIKNCFYFRNSAYNTDEHGNSSFTKFFRAIELWKFCDIMI